jgi:hypothetical protein
MCIFDVDEVVPGRGVDELLQVAKNDSVTASPKQVARRPAERRTPLVVQNSANSFEVY